MSGAPAAASAPGPALTALRRATADQHEEIEALLQLAPPTDGRDAEPLGPARYTAVLQGFDRFLSHWEPLVLAALPASQHGWFRDRSRHGLLRQDLRELSAQPLPHPSAQAALRGLSLPDRAAAFGSMYVLEGSALGGQVIARAVRQVPAWGDRQAVRYFNGHGAETGRLWKEFRERLSQELDTDPAAIQRACGAAVGTFDALIACFEGTPAAVRP